MLVGLIAANLITTVTLVLATSVRARRWLRWTFICRRGRRCTHPTIQHAYFTALDGPVDELPPGLPPLMLTYECPRCGTEYVQTAMLTSPESFVVSDPARTT